jgi:hypothetical protein
VPVFDGQFGSAVGSSGSLRKKDETGQSVFPGKGGSVKGDAVAAGERVVAVIPWRLTAIRSRPTLKLSRMERLSSC